MPVKTANSEKASQTKKSSKKELKKTECEADRIAIRHGLGRQLLEGVNYFYNKVTEQNKQNQ
jgi:hypothetical protein